MEKTDFSDERKEYVKYLESEIPPFLMTSTRSLIEIISGISDEIMMMDFPIVASSVNSSYTSIFALTSIP